VPADLQSIADPRLILLAWAAGLALVAGVISIADVVGPGFTWLTAGVAALVGLPGVFAGGAWWARAGIVALVIGIVLARKKKPAGIALLVAGLGFSVEGAFAGGWIPALTGALALGGVTGEMMLAHWYLIDPRLPRSVLRGLAIVGIVGLCAETGMQLWLEIGSSGGAVGFWVLMVTSIVLMVGVIGALRYPAYSGVMAATGLSYLALLTTLGAVFVGRAVTAGLGPFDL
jgi:hypothetical protein